MDDVEARPEGGLVRERPAPDERGEVRADEWHREQHGVADREPHPREQVVDERVAGVPLEQREHEHRHSEVVGQAAGRAERAGEEHPEQVQDDRDDEDVGCPVVGLADEEPGACREREDDDRPVGLAHLDAVEGFVGAVVDDGQRRGVEEEHQVDAGRDEHHERVERDLTEQERPVVGEEIAQALLQQGRARGRAVERLDGGADHVGLLERTPHHDGPDGTAEVPRGAELTAWAELERQLGEGPAGRPERHRRPTCRIEGRVVAGADERGRWGGGGERRRPVEGDGAACVSADLRVRQDALGCPALSARRQPELRHGQADDHERRCHVLAVGALGVGGVEVLLFDLVGAQRAPVLADEAAALPPGRLDERVEIECRPE